MTLLAREAGLDWPERRSLRLAALLYAIFVLAACEPATVSGVAILRCTSEGIPLPSSAVGASISVDDFPHRFATAYCEGIAACCQASNVPYNEGDCLSNSEAHMRDLISDRARDGKFYDGTAAGECIRAYADALATCAPYGTRSLMNSCSRSLFRGTVPLNGTCMFDSQCEQDCKQARICHENTCRPTAFSITGKGIRAQLGEPCSTSCAHDGRCSSSFSDLGAASGICWSIDGLECLNAVCVPVPELGEACRNNCASGAFCDEATSRCLQPRAEGAACKSNRECLTGVCSAMKCAGDEIAHLQACSGKPPIF
jgi:hypothetical protein